MSNYRYRNEERSSRREREKNFDAGFILRYFALTAIFCAVIFGMREVILYATKLSPTGQVGNGILTLSMVKNTGAAFNLFASQPEMIIIASFLAVAIIAFIAITMSGKLHQTALSAMALLSAGIIMNLSERLQWGYVLDYIHCDFMPNLPVFNTADIMIVFGALGLILSVLTRK